MTKMEKEISNLKLEIRVSDQQEEQLRSNFYAAKRSREVALIQKQKAEAQGLRTDHIMVPPEPVFPAKELHELRHHSLKQSIKLAKLQYKLQQYGDPETIPMYPNYVELMISWGNTMLALWILATITMFATFLAAGESWFVGLFGSAMMFGVIWFPGIIVASALPNVCDALGNFNSVYRDARGIFGYDSKIGWKRFRNISGVRNGLATFLAAFLAVATLIGLIGGIFNESAFDLAIIAGLLLSYGGSLVVGFILVRDHVRGRRMSRQVF